MKYWIQLKPPKLIIEIIQITWYEIDNNFLQMFHGQVNGQVICFFTRSFDLAWPGVAPPLQFWQNTELPVYAPHCWFWAFDELIIKEMFMCWILFKCNPSVWSISSLLWLYKFKLRPIIDLLRSSRIHAPILYSPNWSEKAWTEKVKSHCKHNIWQFMLYC